MIHRPWILLPLLLLLVARCAVAQEAAGQLLLLHSGQVLAGQVRHVEGHYELLQTGREIHFRDTEVAAVCDSWQECYEQQARTRDPGIVSSHLEFADWCIKYRLFYEAEQELTAAEKLEPNQTRIALLRKRLTIAQREPLPRATAPAVAALPASEGMEKTMRELPSGAVGQFTSKVQPLLISHCANAGCHGPASTSDFQLIRFSSKRGGDRRITQRNLEMVLKYVDRDHPKRSQLLTQPIRAHGTAQAAIFTSRNAAQYRHLLAWCQRLSQGDRDTEIDLEDEEVDSVAQVSSRKSAVLPAAANEPSAFEKAFGPATTIKRGANIDPVIAPNDPFDPKQFNQQQGSESPPSSGGGAP